MSTPAIAELGFTIPPSIHCLGDLSVAEREGSIGARISQLRKDKGMTQKELARRLAGLKARSAQHRQRQEPPVIAASAGDRRTP